MAEFSAPEIDLRYGRRLPGNLRQMGAVGRYVPAPRAGSQSVVITGRITTKVQTAKDQLRYMQHGRPGDEKSKGRDGQPASLFGPAGQAMDVAQFVRDAQGDPHQFRMMVSPEKTPEYFLLRPFIEQLMAQMQKDLRRPLDWLAAVHYDTDKTHAHILLRGRDRDGKVLYIEKDYREKGIRYQAMSLATRWMGRTQGRERMIERTRDKAVEPEKIRSIGRAR